MLASEERYFENLPSSTQPSLYLYDDRGSKPAPPRSEPDPSLSGEYDKGDKEKATERITKPDSLEAPNRPKQKQIVMPSIPRLIVVCWIMGALILNLTPLIHS